MGQKRRARFATASFLSYLVFAACYVVGKRKTSALVCPPQVLIKETGKPVIFVLFLAFLVLSVLILASCIVLPFVSVETYPSFVIAVLVLESFVLWVSLNVCHIFASICIVLGRLTDTIGLLYQLNGYPPPPLFLVLPEKLASHAEVFRGLSRVPAPLTSPNLSGKNVDQSQ